MILLAVDPGHSETGIVLRSNDELWDHMTVRRGARGRGDYVTAVLEELPVYAANANYLVVEDVVAPHVPQALGMINMSGILGTALVLGAILGAHPDAVILRPRGFGKGPEKAYPGALWGPREGKAGTGRLRHCRSAWDLAGTAMTLLRQGRLEGVS